MDNLRSGTEQEPRLCVIEDDHDLCEEMVAMLESEGFECWWAASAEDFFRRLFWEKTDIVLVDIMLPGEDGTTIIEQIVRNSKIGIMAITGSMDPTLEGRCIALGADHFLRKPADLDMVPLLVSNLWRRVSNTANFSANSQQEHLWALEPAEEYLVVNNTIKIELSRQEYTLLELIMSQPNAVLTQEELHEHLFPGVEDSDSHRISVVLNRVRKKVKAHGLRLPVRSLYGRGLAFVSQ